MPWRTSLENTLREEGVTRDRIGPGLTTVICGLNPSLCPAGVLASVPSAPPSGIRIPDIPVESALEIIEMGEQLVAKALNVHSARSGFTCLLSGFLLSPCW